VDRPQFLFALVMEHLLAERARTARSSAVRDLLRLVDQPHVLSLAGGLPSAEHFPTDRIAVAAERALRVTGPLGSRSLQYGPTEGDTELRDLLAAREGVSAERVLVTAGSQQGLDLVARALLDPGDVAIVEQPGYLGAIQALRTCGPRLVGIPTDDDGLRTEVLDAELRRGLRPKLVYVVPNFQNPSGAVLSPERRVHLAELAERYDFVVVEDDPYGELRFHDDAVANLVTMTDHVVRLGSSSKILAPGLRVGWVVAPPALAAALVKLKQAADLHTSSLSQRIALDVLADEPFMAQHLATVRSVYAERAEALHAALPAGLAARPARGGLFLWAELTDGADAASFARLALEEGVAFVPGSAFGLDDDLPSPWVRLSFASLAPAQLTVACGRLAQALARRSQSAF
jgi:2-aminoadipate transaminase